jgi:hypothetical protein
LSGLESAKSLFQQYIDRPAEDTLRMPAAEWTQMLYTFIMLNKFVVLDSSESSSLTNNVATNDTNIAHDNTTCQSQWDVQLAVRQADIEHLGGLFVKNIGSHIDLTARLDDGSRPILQALSLLIKEMVDGHKKWLYTVQGKGIDELGARLSYLQQGSGSMLDMQVSPNVEEHSSQIVPPTSVTDTAETPWENKILASPFSNMPFAPEFGSDGIGDNFLWDTMMSDMTALPFGLRW